MRGGIKGDGIGRPSIYARNLVNQLIDFEDAVVMLRDRLALVSTTGSDVTWGFSG